MTAPTSDWDDLTNATPDTIYVKPNNGGRRVDILKEVPEMIRDTLEDLYELYGQDYTTPKGRRVKAGDPKYLDWDAGSPERAAQFIKLAKKYADYRPAGQTTVRANVFNGSWVHFTMKPREARVSA